MCQDAIAKALKLFNKAIGVGAGKQLPGSYVVFRMCPRIFGEVAELIRCNTVTTMRKTRIKWGFYPFCKGFGIYCNGFWGCGALGPHKRNRSDLSHSIKEIEIVEQKISMHRCLASYPAYLIGKCIDLKKECFGYFVRRGSEEKKEREIAKKCVVGTL